MNSLLTNTPIQPRTALTDSERHRLIAECETSPISSGRTQYLRFLNGEKLTYREALLAKCAECCCFYVDGRYDCEVSSCPLYNSMPYRGMYDANKSKYCE